MFNFFIIFDVLSQLESYKGRIVLGLISKILVKIIQKPDPNGTQVYPEAA